jgi:hypothetical protein
VGKAARSCLGEYELPRHSQDGRDILCRKESSLSHSHA